MNKYCSYRSLNGESPNHYLFLYNFELPPLTVYANISDSGCNCKSFNEGMSNSNSLIAFLLEYVIVPKYTQLLPVPRIL